TYSVSWIWSADRESYCAACDSANAELASNSDNAKSRRIIFPAKNEISIKLCPAIGINGNASCAYRAGMQIPVIVEGDRSALSQIEPGFVILGFTSIGRIRRMRKIRDLYRVNTW